jgi:hypothetical protein
VAQRSRRRWCRKKANTYRAIVEAKTGLPETAGLFIGIKSDRHMNDGKGSIVAGLAICWLLNIAQLGIGWLLLVTDERSLPAVYVLIGAISVVQIGYVVPIWRLLVRKGKPRTAKGLLIAAAITAVLNVVMASLS